MSSLDRRSFLKGAAAAGVALALPWEAGAAGGGAEHAARRVGDRALRELARAVRGPVITPGDRGYAQARHVYNRRYDARRPAAVLEASSPRDVRAVVEWANRHGVGLVPRAGGHSYAGYSTTDGGVVVDLRRLRSIGVERGKRRARIEAGCQLIDVYARLARDGATVPAGSCPSVGIGGLALGGGMGLAGRELGLTSDNVTALEIVTADGRLRRVDRDREPDLFWACRGGGGGNFGIVTSFDFRIHRAAHGAWFFVSWPWSAADRALDAWQDFAPDAPDALTSILNLSTGSGRPSVRALGEYFGSERRLRALIRPLTRVAGARVSTGTSSYMALQLRWAGCLDEGLRRCHTRGRPGGGTLARASFDAKSDYVDRRLSGRARQRMIRAIERRQRDGDGSGALILDAYGGAINRIAPDATAFVHRDQRFSIQYLAYHGAGSGRRAARRWVEEAHADMRPHVSGEAYQNYIDPDLERWERAYYGANLERLTDVRSRYDPEGRFAFRQGIPARSERA